MEKEEKQLLLKDLSARLPYGVMCKFWTDDDDNGVIEPLKTGGLESFMNGDIPNVRPFLFPLTSMTDEQKEEKRHLLARPFTDALNYFIDNPEPETELWKQYTYGVIETDFS